MSHKRFDMDEVADYLHMERSQVERLVKEHAIPCRKQGDRFVFVQQVIDAWAAQRIMKFQEKELHDFHSKSSAKAHNLSRQHALIPELMQVSYVKGALTSKTVPSIVRDMVGLSVGTGLVVYPEDLLASIQEREKLCSTALTGGFALLHPQHHEPYMFEDSFITLGRTIQPVPFGSPDGRTSDLFFMLCCQDDRIHLHVLARLCMMCQYTSLILELREAEDEDEMMCVLIGAEQEVIRKI